MAPFNINHVRQLLFFAAADWRIHSQKQAILENVRRKITHKMYIPRLGYRMWRPWINIAAAHYHKEFKTLGIQLFSPSDRTEASRRIAASEYMRIQGKLKS